MGLLDDIIGGIEHTIDNAAHGVTAAASTVGNAIETGAQDLYHAVFGGGATPSAGGSGMPGPNVSLTDIRWEGMSNQQLSQVVQQLSQGSGATGMQQAADVLAGIAQALLAMDNTLRQQLQAIGVNWQSDASALAQQMSKAAADYAGTAGDTGSTASGGVSQTGETYSTTKNSAPPAHALNGPTANSAIDNLVHVVTLTTVTTDHAQQVAQTNAARTQTIDVLRGYAGGAQSAINSYTPPPIPPGLGLTTSSVDTSLGQIGSVPGYSGSAPVIGGGSSMAGGAIGGSAGAGSGPGMAGLPPVGGIPGGMPVPPVAGGGVGSPSLPGPISGVGPNPASLGAFGAGGVGSGAVGNYAAAIEDAGVASLIAGGATAAGTVGAGRDGGKSGGRSTPAEQQAQKDVFGNDPEFQDPAHAGPPASAAARSLVSFEESAAAAEAQAAERFAVATQQAEPSFLQPATGGRPGDDDRSHSSKYVQGEDVFGDGRMVTPPVIGDNEPTEPPAGASGDPAEDTDGDDRPAGFGD